MSERDTRADDRDRRADERDAAPVVIPQEVARQANRAIFFRYLSILAVLALAVIGYLGYHNVQKNEEPCVTNLHGAVCQARTCERLNDIGYKLTPECRAVLRKVRDGEQSDQPGDSRPGASAPPAGRGGDAETKPTTGSSQLSPGDGAVSVGSGGSASAAKPLLDFTTPSLPLLGQPKICLQPIAGIDLRQYIAVNC